jgi:hypothetical protein
MSKYMSWQLMAPPATRFYQMADGNFCMYFERSKVGEMVKWAEQQLEAFQRLEIFIGDQAIVEEKAEVEKARKKEELAARASNVSPKAASGHTPNLRTKEAVTKVEEAKKPVPKGVKPPKPSIAGQPLTTQEEVTVAVPTLPKPKVEKNLALMSDPGMRIAMEQAKMLDQQNRIDREKRNEASDEEEAEEDIGYEEGVGEPEGVDEPIPDLETEPTPPHEEEIPATERPEVQQTQPQDG